MICIKKIASLFCGHQQEMAFLNRKIADLQALIPVEEPKPDITLFSLLPNGVKLDIQPLSLKMMYPALIDSQYYYTKAEDWAEVFDYIYFKFDMPNFIAEKMDCDDFSLLLKSLVASFFGLNYFGVVVGDAPGGRHAWNIFRTEDGLMQFEPQTGDYFPVGEQGYVPEYILI